MQSSLTSKIEKARRYAQEKDRATFTEFKVSFRGEHNNYTISYKDEKWHCSCRFFSRQTVCSHTMALQLILAEMLPEGAVSPYLESTS